jgi:transposase
MPGRTVASVAQELKIPAWKLRNWLQESRVKLERSSDMDQLVRLQNELKRAKEEIEILKKAAAYFAKSLP